MTATVQQSTALAKANAVRVERAAIKREIAAGDRSVIPILLGTDEPRVIELTECRPVVEILQWQTRWGKSRARRVLWLMNASEHITPAQLSQARREALVGLLASEHGTVNLDQAAA